MVNTIGNRLGIAALMSFALATGSCADRPPTAPDTAATSSSPMHRMQTAVATDAGLARATH